MPKTTQILIDVNDAAALKDAARWMHPDLYAQVKARAAELSKLNKPPKGAAAGTFHNIIWHGIPAVNVRVATGE